MQIMFLKALQFSVKANMMLSIKKKKEKKGVKFRRACS